MARYYEERGPSSAGRYASLAPGHEGEYVSRRQHQIEIGKPLQAFRWKEATSVSKAGRERTIWSKGDKNHSVALSTLRREFERLIPVAQAAGRSSLIISIQYKDSGGEWKWFSNPVPADKRTLDDMDEYENMLSMLLAWAGEVQDAEHVYLPEKTGGVQIIMPPPVEARKSA